MAIRTRKNKKGFNGMDLFIIIVLALIVLAAVFVLKGMNKDTSSGAEETIEIEYTVEFRALSSYATGSVKEGDIVKDPDSKQNIGSVVAVQRVPYSTIAYNESDGSVYMSEHPDFTDLLLTIRADATHNDKGYYTGGARFLVGKYTNIWSPGFIGSGYCISIREIN